MAWDFKVTSHNPCPQADSGSDVPIAELPGVPKLGTEYFPGFGFVMRNGFPHVDETYI